MSVNFETKPPEKVHGTPLHALIDQKHIISADSDRDIIYEEICNEIRKCTVNRCLNPTQAEKIVHSIRESIDRVSDKFTLMTALSVPYNLARMAILRKGSFGDARTSIARLAKIGLHGEKEMFRDEARKEAAKIMVHSLGKMEQMKCEGCYDQKEEISSYACMKEKGQKI